MKWEKERVLKLQTHQGYKNMKTYSEQEIYKFVSSFYKNKELGADEFSNRLYAIKCIVLKGYLMRDAIDFLDMREHWWEFDSKYRTNVKAVTRRELKLILKTMNLDLTKEGLKELE